MTKRSCITRTLKETTARTIHRIVTKMMINKKRKRIPSNYTSLVACNLLMISCLWIAFVSRLHCANFNTQMRKLRQKIKAVGIRRYILLFDILFQTTHDLELRAFLSRQKTANLHNRILDLVI